MDEKTNRKSGFLCGEEIPESFLSDSNKIVVRFNSTDTPQGFFVRGYAFTYKAVAATHTLKPKFDPMQFQQQNVAMMYPEVFGYGAAPANRPYGSVSSVPQYRQIPQSPQFGVESPIGRNPDVEYMDRPPQYDNPFAVNDYEYDYGEREYGDYIVSARGVVPKPEEKTPRKRRPKRIQSVLITFLNINSKSFLLTIFFRDR